MQVSVSSSSLLKPANECYTHQLQAERHANSSRISLELL